MHVGNTTLRQMGTFFHTKIIALGDKTGKISFIELYSQDLILNQIIVPGIKIDLYSSISYTQEIMIQ